MKILLLVTAFAIFKDVKGTDKPEKFQESPVYPTGSIIEEVIPHSIPYQAQLEMKYIQESSYCEGSLITPNYVLTAAQCLKDVTAIKVKLGFHNLWNPTGDEIVISAKNWEMHEDFDPTLNSNDIGLVELSKSVNLSNNIGLARLPSYNNVGKNLQGLKGQVSSWNGKIMLLSMTSVVISNEKCYFHLSGITNKIICLSDHQCFGSHGGIMVINGVQMGIVTKRGVDFCVYTRIDQFLDWIELKSDWKSSKKNSD